MDKNLDLQHLGNRDKAKDTIMKLFRSTHKIFREQVFEKSKQYGYTGPQILVVFELFKKPFCTLNEISEQLGLSKSTVSGIVDRLVARGTVIREIPEDNRRTVRLSISPEFSAKNDFKELKEKYFDDILENATEEDFEKIILGLEKLHSLMNGNKEANE